MYQTIVTAAKQAGGVPQLISKIDAAAVARVTPGLIGKGVAVGAVGALVVRHQAVKYWKGRKARLDDGAQAQEELTAVMEAAGETDGHQDAEPSTPSEADD